MSNKLFVYVPAFGHQISTATYLTSMSLLQALGAKGVSVGITSLSFPDIGESRNMALTVFYDAMVDSSHILFVDADMGFPPELVLDMLMFNEPVVGTCYRKRVPNVEWTPSGTGEPTAELRGGFMHVEGVGMGCTLIRRDAVTTMLEQFPEIIDERVARHPANAFLQGAGVKRIIRAFDALDIPDRGRLSEDLSFCLRWNQCGGKVWANITHNISHVGLFDYAGSYAQITADQMAQQAAAQAALEAAQAAKQAPARPMLVAAE